MSSHRTVCHYSGQPNPSGPSTITVDFDDGTSEDLPAAGLHNDDGFKWGFDGAGPKETAYSILSHHAGKHADPDEYLPFAKNLVADWPEDRPWAFTPTQIECYLKF